MAKLDFVYPIEAVHGKLKGNFGAYKHAKNAKGISNNFSVNYGKRSTAYSADEVAQQNLFGTIVKMVATRMKNNTQRIPDKQAFAAQSTYKTLRQYLYHVCKAQLEAQDNDD